jgi:hypothetical protein
MKKEILFLVMLFNSLIINCNSVKDVDLSSPESTIDTYFKGYETANKYLIEKATGNTNIMSKGLDPILIGSHKIISKKYITSDSLYKKKGDVLILVKVFYLNRKFPPVNIFHLLRYQDYNWIIVEHWIASNENYKSDE